MSGLIVLSRSDLQQLMQLGDYVEFVAQAFAMHAGGRDRRAGRVTCSIMKGERL